MYLLRPSAPVNLVQPAGRTRRRGAHVVEFAFVAPVLFTLIFGMIELGRACMVLHLLYNAARIGCRAAATAAPTNTGTGTSTATITSTVQGNLTGMGIPNDVVDVTINDGSADASTAKSGDEVTVKVKVKVKDFTWVPTGVFGYKWLDDNSYLYGQYTLNRD